MTKIGRNERCPCGSGKKYKKCCGATAAQQSKYATDRVTARILDLYSSNIDKIRTRFAEVSQQLIAARQTLLAECPSDIEKTQQLLELYAATLEQSMQRVLERASPTFWLSLERRFPPWLHLSSISGSPGLELQVLRECRLVGTALLLKHGSSNTTDWRPNYDGTMEINPTPADVVDMLGCVQPYINEIGGLAILYRRVGKGGRLVIDGRGVLDAVLDDEIERAADLYTRRRQLLPATFGSVGLPTTFAVIDAPNPGDLALKRQSLFFLDYNIDATAEYSIPSTGLKVKGPGFKPRVALLKDIFHSLQPFESKIEEITGFSLVELELAFTALTTFLVKIYDGPGGYTCLTRGLVFCHRDWMIYRLRSELRSVSEGQASSINVEEVIAKLVVLLRCRADGIRDYDVFLRRGCGCLLEQDYLVVLDFTLVLQTLNDLLLDMQLDNDMRRIKGTFFEKTVVEELRRDVPRIEFPMKPGLRLKRKDSRQILAEADLYIKLGVCLILVDCKSYSVTREYLKGTHRAVTTRWEIVKQWIKENDDRARLIARTADPGNYQIPPGTTHIIPLVCSAFAEFIWGMKKEWFLSEVPRVCTYAELVRLLREGGPAILEDKSYVVPIAH